MFDVQRSTFFKKSLPILMVWSLFVFCLATPWLWFHLPASSSELLAPIRLVVSTNVPGYTFIPKSVGEEALDILGTTNIINGEFAAISAGETGRHAQSNSASSTSDDGVRSTKSADWISPAPASISFFLASWQANSSRGLTVVHHTPDICWVGAGWKPVDAGQSMQITLGFPLKVVDANRSTIVKTDGLAFSNAKKVSEPSTVRLPFECRVFESPNDTSKVLVIWCTLVGGRVLSERGMFNEVFKQTEVANPNAMMRMAASARRLSADQLWQSIRQRRSPLGVKQFVRLSLVISGDWPTALEQIKRSALQLIYISQVDRRILVGEQALPESEKWLSKQSPEWDRRTRFPDAVGRMGVGQYVQILYSKIGIDFCTEP